MKTCESHLAITYVRLLRLESYPSLLDLLYQKDNQRAYGKPQQIVLKLILVPKVMDCIR